MQATSAPPSPEGRIWAEGPVWENPFHESDPKHENLRLFSQ
jgi:hypothetical protein